MALILEMSGIVRRWEWCSRTMPWLYRYTHTRTHASAHARAHTHTHTHTKTTTTKNHISYTRTVRI